MHFRFRACGWEAGRTTYWGLRGRWDEGPFSTPPLGEGRCKVETPWGAGPL